MSDQTNNDEPARGELSGFHVVDPELYRRYRAEIVQMSNSHQVNINEFLPAGVRQRAMTDAEIADELGLDLRDVTEIRVVAEHDEFPIEEYEASARFKDAAAASYRQGGVKNLYRGNPPPTLQ
jgi:DNA-directed RNA polymerase specialized sigma subunit